MNKKSIYQWLLEGDVAIQFQTYRDLLNENRVDIQNQIHLEGWGKEFLDLQKPNKHWGNGFYNPKWISTHYTLLDLRNLNIKQNLSAAKEAIYIILKENLETDGGINPGKTVRQSDVCINGMFLNYAAYFKIAETQLQTVVDFVLSQQLGDGGFNCQYNRSGAKHSSLHSTISVLEGFTEYLKQGYKYKKSLVEQKVSNAKEFILMHKLFRSDKTGEIIHPRFLKMSYPCRWYYDILRALDYFQYSDTSYDPRMQDAIDVLLQKQRKDGLWNVQAAHPGKIHFSMEKAGKASRWNTLRAYRVLKRYYNSAISWSAPFLSN